MVWAERRRLLVALAGAAALLAVWIVYAPARSGVLIGEDHTLVRDARWKTAPVSALFTRPLWPESRASDVRVPHYRPVALASYRLDHALGGGSSELHFTNVLLHALACALVALVAARLGARGGAAVLAALAWALAPRLTESVAWVSGRADLLAGALGFAALALSPDATNDAPSRGAAAWARSAASGALILLALGASWLGVAFAAALVAAAVVRRRGEARAPRARVVRSLACALVPVVAFALVRWRVLEAAPAPQRARVDPALAAHAVVALESLGRYAEMILRPFSPATSIGAEGVVGVAHVVAGVVAIVLAAVLARRVRKTAPPGTAIPASLGAAALLVILSYGELGSSDAVAADRYLYVPLAALAIGAAVAAGRLPPRWTRAGSVALLALVVALAGATKARAEDYQDEVGFWVEAAERAHPANPYARSALAVAVIDRGRTELGCRLLEASRAILERAGRAGSVAHRRAREAEATCLARIGRLDEARATFEDLVREHPEVGRLHMGLAYVRLHLLDFDGAERAFARAAAIDPVLSPFIAHATAELARARAEVASFDTPEERRRDRAGYAAFLVSVGRLADAIREMDAVAEDGGQPGAARRSAAWFLANYADVELARRAGHAAYGPVLASMDADLLERRERRASQVTAHERRIEALAAPP